MWSRTLLLALLLGGADAARRPQMHARHKPAMPTARRGSTPSVVNCTEWFFTQRIDHLTSEVPPTGNTTFHQRVYSFDEYWEPGGPIFFYTGNEADVQLYVNATGLMWENAAAFKAKLVWAEHRYFGESQPFGTLEESFKHQQYLSVEQALADFAVLAQHLRDSLPDGVGDTTAIVSFGGSYGGMLSSWFRFKYPHIVDGAIAASAPIWSFEDEDPACDPNFYAQGVSFDLTPDGGVGNEWCEANFRAAFADERLAYIGATAEGRAALEEAFQLCEPLGDDPSSGWEVAYWINDALSYMAMGDYPYPSSYILNGDGVLPAFPVVLGCDSFLDTDLTAVDPGCADDLAAPCPALLEGLAGFAGIYYNYSGTLTCNNLTASVNEEAQIVDALWNHLYCSEIFQVFGQDGVNDVFWPAPWNATASAEACYSSEGIYPRQEWLTQAFGDHADWARATSNIVWSQGQLDPWRGGGPQVNLTDSLRSIIIEHGAHHLDLMFSTDEDPKSVLDARAFEMANVQQWIDQRAAA